MNIMWLGTASLFLETDNTRIVFDPFLEMPAAETIRKTKIFHDTNDVCITHGHFDHIAHMKKLYQNYPVTIHCTSTPKNTLIKEGLPEWYFHEIHPDDAFRIGDFDIRIFQARHCVFDAGIIRKKLLSLKTWKRPEMVVDFFRLSKKYPENGEMILYDIHAESIHLQILGSMGLDPDVQYPEGADVLILALQGRSDQDISALDLVERLKPKKVLLYHIDDAFAPISEDVDTSGFVRNVKEKFDIPCRPMEKYIRLNPEEL